MIGFSRAHVENTCPIRGVNTYDMVSVNARVMHDAMGQVINVPHEHLELEVAVPQDGYMFIYLVNESRDDTDVYFDDFTISHIGVDILKTTDFYPFGLALKNWQKEDYRFGYQGQFAEMDEETGWNSFELRMYDPVIGRWLSTDPYGEFFSPYISVGNNPISGVDPTGGLTGTDPIKAFVAAGGTVLDEVVVTSTRISTSTIVGGISGAGRVIASSGLEVEFNIPTPRELIGIGLGGSTYTPNTLQSIGYNLTNYQLKPVDPTFFDFWSESTNIMASTTYEMLDGIYLTLQTFYRLPSSRRHLNGAGVMGSDLMDGFVNTATLLAPGGLASKPINKTIVIGESMPRVVSAARSIGARWYRAWGKNFPKNRPMTPDEIAKALKRNERWIKSMIKKGYDIIDIGLDPNRATRSPFYQMEKEILKRHNYPAKIQ